MRPDSNGSTLRYDPREIRRTIELIAAPAFEHGGVVELRALGTNKATVSGYFDGDHTDALASCAAEWSGKAKAVYFTPNPVMRDCLARAANRVELYAKNTTGDAEIIRRLWLLVDTDPERPSGISATDAEHELGLERIREIRAWLTAKGFGQPILADSGNGGHLMYRIDVEADDGGLIQRVLKPDWRDKPVTLKEAALTNGGAELTNNRGFQFERAEQLLNVAASFDGELVIPESHYGCPAQAKANKDGRLIVRIKSDQNPGAGWLKKAGWWEKVTDVSTVAENEWGKGPSLAELLIGMSADDQLFHNSKDEAFATIGGETVGVKSKSYQLVLRKRA